MPQDRPFEWTSENVTAFWDFESTFPDRYFTYHNADGMIRRLSKYISGSEAILDYGCGTGLLLARLAEQGYRVAGSDTSEQSLEATRHRLQGYDTFLGAFTPDALLAEGRQFDAILRSSWWSTCRRRLARSCARQPAQAAQVEWPHHHHDTQPAWRTRG